MSRTAVCTLIAFLLAWGLLNTWVINTRGRRHELYPMTAWQMFSGRPKEVVRHFEFEIVPAPGAEAVVVPGEAMFMPEKELSVTQTRRLLQGVWKSCEYGCDGVRLNNFRECKENPVRPWIIPRELADGWVACAMEELALSEPPELIRFVRVEQELDERARVVEGTERRYPVLAWRPGSGGYAVEPEGNAP